MGHKSSLYLLQPYFGNPITKIKTTHCPLFCNTKFGRYNYQPTKAALAHTCHITTGNLKSNHEVIPSLHTARDLQLHYSSTSNVPERILILFSKS